MRDGPINCIGNKLYKKLCQMDAKLYDIKHNSTIFSPVSHIYENSGRKFWKKLQKKLWKKLNEKLSKNLDKQL